MEPPSTSGQAILGTPISQRGHPSISLIGRSAAALLMINPYSENPDVRLRDSQSEANTAPTNISLGRSGAVSFDPRWGGSDPANEADLLIVAYHGLIAMGPGLACNSIHPHSSSHRKLCTMRRAEDFVSRSRIDVAPLRVPQPPKSQ